MPKSVDPFARIPKAIKHLRIQIDAEWKRAQPELRRLVAKGDYAGERMYLFMVFARINKLRREVRELQLSMPPFVTEKDGVLWKHPVTDENRHLLT